MLEIRKTTRSGHATVLRLSPTPAALTIEIRETPCRFIAASICATDCESSVGGDTIDEKGLLPRRKRKPSAVTTASLPVTAISTNAASRGSPRTTLTPWGDTGARALAHQRRYLVPSLDGEPYKPLTGRAVGAEYDQFHRPFNAHDENCI